MTRRLVITSADITRLESLVSNSPSVNSPGLEALALQLELAEVVAPDKVSERVVTMNTRVRVQDLDHETNAVWSLVFPAEANAELRKVSVLAPLGISLLGRRVGDVVKFQAPGGLRKVRIEAIEYQPEADARQRRATPVDEDNLVSAVPAA